ncbi:MULTISPECIES: CBS domain-containing protein [Haloferacaceae]|jgi:CBS domain-containing protein|uniref:CBS domain-containing protein n=1 Tax=Halogeometricum luteum TaxID=2950537 RepID=A0ABU2G8N9_9EURY|nr:MULTISPECIES: CBS domain-containing protein [Haloferacales]MDS0296826.1 CBS domain-containing protein [Halogeometricum sp. S3BR5-2]
MGTRPTDLRMDIGRIADESVARVAPDATVAEIAHTMISQSRCARYVVVEEADQLAGIITDRDLIADLLTEESEFSVLAAETSGDNIRANDIMTRDPLTVSADAEIPKVLRQMNDAGARHVPVIEDESVVGMITLDDLITHVAGESAHVSAQMDNVAGIIRTESTHD